MLEKLLRLKNGNHPEGAGLLTEIIRTIDSGDGDEEHRFAIAASVFDGDHPVVAGIWQEAARRLATCCDRDYRMAPGTTHLRIIAATLKACFDKHHRQFDVLAVWREFFADYEQLEIELRRHITHLFDQLHADPRTDGYFLRQYGGSSLEGLIRELSARPLSKAA